MTATTLYVVQRKRHSRRLVEERGRWADDAIHRTLAEAATDYAYARTTDPNETYRLVERVVTTTETVMIGETDGTPVP